MTGAQMSQPPQQPYQQPGWYGAPQQPPPPASNKTALWIGLGVLGLVVVVAVVAITGFVAPGFFLPDRKSEAAASSAAPTSSAQDTTTQSPVQIPTDRLPLPKRPTPLADPTECAYPADTSGGHVPKKATPPAAGPTPASGTTAVTLRTTAGDIGLTLDSALAPCTVANFLSLSRQGFYDSTSCHRIGTSGLQMLQCGDPEASGMGGPGYTIPDEIFPELKYGRGILAMAKTQAPNSGGSQFFMVFGSAELPPDYTVFGSISDAGLQVLDKVASGGVDESQGTGDGTGPPRIPVTFQSVVIG
ncbi:peptidylprolyl isomerase [Amycolatopsis alba DSM 44262]|uniref:Peptidylprolyl isomerase n=2 Tax=Amycolatopsis alba TaxID=76020 RepID=A0A229RIG2_AMYAL|nr:peptidylprolyl isomerase [Amycolatopsis alba DSM 44262]